MGGPGPGHVEIALLQWRIPPALPGGAKGARNISEIGRVAVPLRKVSLANSVIEDDGSTLHTKAELAGEIRSQRRPNRGDRQEGDATLVSGYCSAQHITGSRKDRASGANVDAVGRTKIGLIVV